jgi:hypothetical protein
MVPQAIINDLSLDGAYGCPAIDQQRMRWHAGITQQPLSAGAMIQTEKSDINGNVRNWST